jgi:hypothetical protein
VVERHDDHDGAAQDVDGGDARANEPDRSTALVLTVVAMSPAARWPSPALARRRSRRRRSLTAPVDLDQYPAGGNGRVRQ